MKEQTKIEQNFYFLKRSEIINEFYGRNNNKKNY